MSGQRDLPISIGIVVISIPPPVRRRRCVVAGVRYVYWTRDLPLQPPEAPPEAPNRDEVP